ncbi:MAG TPA: sigma-54-dependent Fis family transcriptional regulator [Kofleriaceae bacterium]
MRLDELDLRELLEFDPKGGVVRFAGDRALILDAVALGLLRKTLIDTVGTDAARAIFTRFGYAHGRRTAATMKGAVPWESENDWRIAGGRLHKLQGLVVPAPVESSPAHGPAPFVENVWHDSYEAEQHLIHLGRSEGPVCWSQCGFASGYLSYANQREIYCIEIRCRGRGDALCHMVCRPRDEWSEELAPQLVYFDMSSLDAALDQVAKRLRQTERKLRSRREQLASYRAEISEENEAKSPAMIRALELAERVSQVDSTVLVTGESGVGKERFARFIHRKSGRAQRPLVAINCGAVPESLLESELFGHVKGAFTGATQDRPGLFEEANGGTLFLDEIGEITPAMQVKLLRALQEHEVRRVGENHNRSVDVRVIAATNRDLAEEVSSGRFRQDLYYRLRVIELVVPPLRERREDILPLARALLASAAQRTKSPARSFTPAAVEQLHRYSWPGNVRELENALERATVMASGTRINVDDLPSEIGNAAASAWVPGDKRALADVERDYILAVLKANGGNRTKTAAHLAIGPATLYRKLAQYGVSRSL